jgi:hypothetical protein
VNEVPFGPTCEALGFVIWYCPTLEILEDKFLLVYIGVRRADNSYYFFLGLLVWFDMLDRGSQVYFRSRSRVVFTRWGPWC